MGQVLVTTLGGGNTSKSVRGDDDDGILATMPWLWLPEELVTHIVSFLQFRDVISLAKTCSFLRRICDSDDVWRPRCAGYSIPKQLEDASTSGTVWKQVFRIVSSTLVFKRRREGNKREHELELRRDLFNRPPKQAATLSLYFRTTETNGGIIVGQQSLSCKMHGQWPHYHHQIVYVDAAGCIRAAFESMRHDHIVGDFVADGRWHHVHLITTTKQQTLWVDGRLVGHLDSAWGGESFSQPFSQIGTGLLSGSAGPPKQIRPNRNDWWPFVGELRDLRLWLEEVPLGSQGLNWNTALEIPDKSHRVVHRDF